MRSSKLLDAIKASGTTPMALDENAIIWQVLAWWLAQSWAAPSVVGELVSGTRNFVDATADRDRRELAEAE